MALISNASPDEIKSPFYLSNKIICEDFEQFILSKNGEVNGKYNAWSYLVYGKIPHLNKWEFKIKKSTYTSSNLLLPTKYQSLQVESVWCAKIVESDCDDFKISKSKWYDFLNKNKAIKPINGYTIFSKSKTNQYFIINLIDVLNPLFIQKKIWSITYQNYELKIETRSEKLHLVTINKLIALLSNI